MGIFFLLIYFLLASDELTNVERTMMLYCYCYYMSKREQSKSGENFYCLSFHFLFFCCSFFRIPHPPWSYLSLRYGARKDGDGGKKDIRMFTERKKVYTYSIEKKCLFWLSPSTLPSHIISLFLSFHVNVIWLNFSHISNLFLFLLNVCSISLPNCLPVHPALWSTFLTQHVSE